MAYNFLSGQYGQTRGSGFAGRATGGRFANIYGYQDGKAITDPQQMAQIKQQQGMAPQSPAPAGGQDFFSQLAGLFGGSAPSATPAGNPNIPQRKPIDFGSVFSRNSQYRPVIAPGGVGPYGGIAEGDRRAMFEGRARGFGSGGYGSFGGRR